MAARKRFNGFSSRNAWLVYQCIFGNEDLRAIARQALLDARGSKEAAADLLIERLPKATPEGVEYRRYSVREALKGF